MKSFGVRFAAGAVTILFGAYAAALAQKDKQDSSDEWTAEVPSLGEPAVPIVGSEDGSWVSQPPMGGADAPVSIADTGPEATPFQSAAAIQLVQHTESIASESEAREDASQRDLSALPASLGEPSSSAGATLSVPDWTLPAQGDNAGGEPSATAAAAMTFPGQGSQSDVMSAGPPTPNANGAPSMALPEMKLGSAPDMGGFDTASSQGPSSSNLDSAGAFAAGALAAGAVAAGASISGDALQATQGGTGQPTNSLRGGSDAGFNGLRGESGFAGGDSPADAATPPRSPFAAPASGLQGDAEMAQDAPGFGQSARQFDQPDAPGSFAGAPPSGFSTPQSEGFAQQNTEQPNTEQQNSMQANSMQAVPMGQARAADPAARIASLPGAADSYGASGDYPQAAMDPLSATNANQNGAVDPNATVASPGDRRLEGAQTPSVIIQKRAPSEVKVGKPASFVIQVQNVGTVEALDVQVNDRIPAGMRLIDASPRPFQQGDLLVWQIGAMGAGEERTLTMQLVPEQEGELGSVARVSFEAAASVRTISTRPELKIVQTAPETVLIGQQLEIGLEVSNPGTGDATGVVLQEDVPEGLEHPKGRQLDNSLGTLTAGEVRNQVLRLRAVEPGMIQNTIRLAGDDGLTAEHTVAVQVIAPALQVELSGPTRRFLERQATYQLNVANTGTADATNIELAVKLDRGFTFVSTDYEGQYDSSAHAVYWSLEQLPAGESGTVPITLLPVQEGEQAIVIEARADLGVTAKSDRKLTVEGFAELSFAITNQGGPIEMGAETGYQIRVTNSGSKPNTNVRVQVQLPQGLELVNADSDAGTDGRGMVVFQPKSQLAPGDEMKFNLRVRGVAPGAHLVRAVVLSDQSTVPVTKEESTLVYADQ